MIALADARAMVAQMAWTATLAQQDAIAAYMVQENTNALHAAWMLYGRPRGFTCRCSPCLADPPIGSEVVLRLIPTNAEVR